MIDTEGPYYYVVFQSPGPNWVAGTPDNEQPWLHGSCQTTSARFRRRASSFGAVRS